MGYESSAERWSPVQSVEKILLSVVSMLAGNSRPASRPASAPRLAPRLARPCAPAMSRDVRVSAGRGDGF